MHLNIALFTHFDKHSECSHMTLNIANLFHTSGSGLQTGVLVDPVSTCLPGPWRLQHRLSPLPPRCLFITPSPPHHAPPRSWSWSGPMSMALVQQSPGPVVSAAIIGAGGIASIVVPASRSGGRNLLIGVTAVSPAAAAGQRTRRIGRPAATNAAHYCSCHLPVGG